MTMQIYLQVSEGEELTSNTRERTCSCASDEFNVMFKKERYYENHIKRWLSKRVQRSKICF